MNAGQNQMSGQCAAQCHRRGHRLPNFTDHDDVGIMPQQLADPLIIAQMLTLIDLNLHEAFRIDFNRIFQREDLGWT